MLFSNNFAASPFHIVAPKKNNLLKKDCQPKRGGFQRQFPVCFGYFGIG